MTDKALEQAFLVEAAAVRTILNDDEIDDRRSWFEAGAAYVMERMKCGECKYLREAVDGELDCSKVPGVYPPDPYWGCRLWKEKE